MSTQNVESCVINAPVDKVWDALRKQDFEFWSLVKSVELPSSTSEVGGVRTTTFTDGTVQKHRLTEYSELKRAFTYELIESDPSVTTLSAQHSIRVYPVTANNTTFVQWRSTFSATDSLASVSDSKYKKLDALGELVKTLTH
ncbi:hypothetical protein GGI25_006167 [Coemansia spiralis]|uniref:Uncharacterized protein n=2 Tax=Coemansia TaxID=4863 RepID=A0A9W8KVK3_9FUNG|nr:hypothetical protein BX070DRAFT_230075 [Coemansia spiralis]KAJ1986833.1 hypothetical protein EDC05_006143 [Coemansia umbellata]KAJ2618880.1 hypothetical protein GGI26_006263 [Coemansia sp. RSA 1358]KAJ2669396.1 hypothetical protein GGI25_006167 [Coemansia spiralis]